MSPAHSELNSIVQDLTSEFHQLNLTRVYVGYSGGVDSTLLLKLAADILGPEQVTALHVNHGLSANAGQWQLQCQQTAKALGVAFVAVSGSVVSAGQGIEAAARNLRYQCFEQQLPDNATLLLGHHLDDQVETFFLRLFRGAGVQGLKAMPKVSKRAHFKLYRPLLDLPKTQLQALAQALSLSWVEDESNSNEQFDRNFLRESVLPLVESRWPAYRDRIHSVVELLNSDATTQQADMSAELAHRISHDGGLKLVQLEQFSNTEKMTLLHSWLHSIGQQIPSKARLQAIVDDVIEAKADASPKVVLGNGFIRRHGPALYWVESKPAPAPAPKLQRDVTSHWPGVGDVALITTEQTPALRADLPELHWRLRQGGEAMRPYGRSKGRDLKRLLQEYRIKPWLRDVMPLLYSGDELIAVGDELISQDHLAPQGQTGLKVIWQKA